MRARRWHQGSALFAKAVHGEGWAGAIPQQPLQGCAVICLDAHTGIDREATVLVGQHVFGVSLLDQGAPDKGAQDALAQASQHLGHGNRIKSTGRVEDNALRGAVAFATESPANYS